MHKLLAICIILFYFQKIALSFQIYKLNSKAVNDIPSLKEIIQRERNQEIEHVKNNQAARPQERRRPKTMGKSLLVKRIIPHGYVGSGYEYDPKLNTVFKPLVRFHVRTPIAEHEKAILKDLEAVGKRERKGQFSKGKYPFRAQPNRFGKVKKEFRKVKDRFWKRKNSFRKGKGRYGDAVIVLVKKDPRNQHDLLRKIQRYIQNGRKPQKKIKKRFRSILGRLKQDDNDKVLRMLLEKSGEIRDPLAPGKIPEFLLPEEPPPIEEPILMHHTYPFWNYWTYKKNILLDECKGNLVKMGNMCINSIGHRKYMEPIQNSINHVNPRRKSVNPWKLLKSLKPLKLASLKKKKPPKKEKIPPPSPRNYRKFQDKK